MDLLVLGDPADPRTDVGPVIDQAAYDKLMAYRAAPKGTVLKTLDAPAQRPVRAADPDPARRDRGPDRRMVRPDPACRDLARGQAVGDDRAGQRQGLWPDDGPAQPHRARRRRGRGGSRGRQPLHQPLDDRRDRRQSSRSAAKGCRAPGRRRAGRITSTASSPNARCRSTRPQRGRQRHPVVASTRAGSHGPPPSLRS